MATFKAVVYRHHKKKDGTYNVKIRVIHNRVIRYIPTAFFVTKEDMTKSLKIKNQDILDALEARVRKYRNACNSAEDRISTMSVDQVVELVTKEPDKFHLDFVQFGREVAGEKKSPGTANIYLISINALCKFAGKQSIDVSEITSGFMEGFLKWIDGRMLKSGRGRRARSLYPSTIRALHNIAKDRYNDEDAGVINIPHSPFKKFKIPPMPVTRKRALSKETIREIISLPYEDKKNSRYNIAKDVFILSLGLIGMNTVDMYNCTRYEGGRIIYNRTKTRSRRKDMAEISIKVDHRILQLFEKYRDSSGRMVFEFYRMFSSHTTFNACVNKELKSIGEKVGVPGLNFYSARHSWATLAVNTARVDKYTVHAALNHADTTMRVTDIYIKKDYSLIDEANEKVLDIIYSPLGLVDGIQSLECF